MLLGKDGEGWNAWSIAAFGGEVYAMREILELAKGRRTTE